LFPLKPRTQAILASGIIERFSVLDICSCEGVGELAGNTGRAKG
jgi:hypothetical protein